MYEKLYVKGVRVNMDYRDTDELYSKKAERKYERLTHNQRQSEGTKNIIVTTIALAVTFCMVTVMVSQLASCTTIPLDSYDKHLIHFHEKGIELPNCEWCNTYTDEDN
tara:strand:+ start:470 stop:793 length:324 start_codon:yes stop_codon:yes gene_type:complete